MKNSFLRREIRTLACMTALFLFVSCIDGYENDGIWSAGVSNTTLESPKADGVTITPNADGTKLNITWPVVLGAGGYQFSLYIVDDPENPEPVGEIEEVIDGCAAERDMREDTYYKVVIKSLGNPTYNNTEAKEATEVAYNNLLPITAVIPAGTNLTEYFTTSPIPASATELCYELEAGGDYTMTGNIAIGQTSVTFRGNKVDHAKIKLTDGSFVNSGAGLKLKFLDIDCTEFAGVVTSNAIILMDTNLDAARVEATSTSGHLVISASTPIAIQSCEIKGLKQYLFYDSGKKYAIGTLLLKDCIIGQNTSTFGQATIRFASGMVKDMTFTSSTFYNEAATSHSSNRFCQISSGHTGNVKPLTETWASGSMTYSNCTFYQLAKTAQSFNSNGAMGQGTDRVIIQNCLVVDSGENGGFVRRLRRGNTSALFTAGNNSYWYDGAFPAGEIESGRDGSGTHVSSDPGLVYQGNGVFTMSGAEQIAKRIGDPRWLPAE